MRKIFNNRWFLLVFISLTWGSSFILIKKSLLVFSPYEIGAIRVVGSGLILAIIGIPTLLRMRRNTLFWIIIAGFFGNFLPMFLFPIAQTQVSSSLAGILDSLVPIFILIFGFVFFGIKSKFTQVLGAVIGFIGAASLIFFTKGNSENSQFGYAMLIILGGASYAINSLIVKEKLPNLDAIKLTAAVYSFWAIPSLVILYFTGMIQNFEMKTAYVEPLFYMAFLTVFGTAIAMLLYFKLIQNTSAVFASISSYLLPVVAIIWGILDGEEFSFWYILGAILILIGIYLIREKPNSPKIVPK
ncbi:DMT family transporter [Flavobacterium sp.]|uniref:DMT family transporter n=1 Tax=Flavobacterium sp. TaxID=239 RepID=UPI00261073B0|nr:DMT family transporter [Flavobacterium sp.]MDD2986399.1 DMT family transporter [Flavobacterium sp.]